MRTVLTSFLTLIFLHAPGTTLGWWQHGGSDNGDPANIEIVTKLARYGMHLIVRDQIFPKTLIKPAHLPKSYHDKNIDLTAEYRKAFVKLRVVSEPGTGILIKVRQSPYDPNQRALFVDPGILRDYLKLNGEWDLTQTVIHDIFQTRNIPGTQTPFDKEGEITGYYFKGVSKDDYLAWKEKQGSNSFFSPKLKGTQLPLAGTYVSNAPSGFSKGLTIDIAPGFLAPTLKGYQGRSLHGLSKHKIVGLEILGDSIDLLLKKGDSGFSYQGRTRANMTLRWYHPWEAIMTVEILTNGERFWLRDRLTDRYGRNLLTHFQEPFTLRPSDVIKAYEAALDEETLPNRAKILQLFISVLNGDKDGKLDPLLKEIGPNVRDWRKRTPLMLAAWTGNLPMVEKLLPISDRKAVDAEDRTLMDHATEKVAYQKGITEKIIEAILKYPTVDVSSRALLFAIQHQNYALALHMLEQPLLPSIAARSIALGYLLKSSLDPQDKAVTVIRKLLEKGVSQKAQEKTASFLYYNYWHGYFSDEKKKVFTDCLLSGLNPNVTCFPEERALLGEAVSEKDTVLIEFLLKKAKITPSGDTLDRKQLTPMALAIDSSQFELAKTLLPISNPHLKVDKTQGTYLHLLANWYAKGPGAQETHGFYFKLAEEKKVDINAKNNQGHTVLDTLAETLRGKEIWFCDKGSKIHKGVYRYPATIYYWLKKYKNAQHSEGFEPIPAEKLECRWDIEDKNGNLVTEKISKY